MKIIIPSLNPILFHDDVTGLFARDSIPSFERKRLYLQKFTTADFVYLQFHFTSKPVSFVFYLIDENDVIKDTIPTSLITDITYPNWYSYSVDYNFADNGIYYLKGVIQTATQTAVIVSEPIAVAGSWKNSAVLYYHHNENDFDVLFTTQKCRGFMMRLECGMESNGFQPSGKYEIYKDLDYKSKQLNAYLFNVEKFTFGPSAGVPQWVPDKLNRMVSLSTFSINGIEYVRNDGAKWERVGVDGYPLAAWKTDLVKKDNPYSDQVTLYGNPIIPLTWDSGRVTFDNSRITFDATQY